MTIIYKEEGAIMSEHMTWLEYKNKKILYANFTNVKDATEFIKRIDEMETEILKYKKRPGVIYTISDITNSHVTTDVKSRFEALVKSTEGISKAKATVGVQGIQKIIANAIKKDMHFAASVDDAKEWLVNQ